MLFVGDFLDKSRHFAQKTEFSLKASTFLAVLDEFLALIKLMIFIIITVKRTMLTIIMMETMCQYLAVLPQYVFNDENFVLAVGMDFLFAKLFLENVCSSVQFSLPIK